MAERILWASFATQPDFAERRTVRGRKAVGVRYERSVQEELLARHPHYVPSPWFRYRTECSAEHRWCQPDGLHIDPLRGRITIIEVKYQHTDAAWKQLWEVYAPVVSFLFPASLWTVSCVEIVKWYDGAVSFPGRTVLLHDPFMRFDRAATGVYIFNPSRNRAVLRPQGDIHGVEGGEHGKTDAVRTAKAETTETYA